MQLIHNQWYRYNNKYYQYTIDKDGGGMREAGKAKSKQLVSFAFREEELQLDYLEPDFRGPNAITMFNIDECEEMKGRLVLHYQDSKVLVEGIGVFYLDGKKSRGDIHPTIFSDVYQAHAYFAEQAYQTSIMADKLFAIIRSKDE